MRLFRDAARKLQAARRTAPLAGRRRPGTAGRGGSGDDLALRAEPRGPTSASARCGSATATCRCRRRWRSICRSASCCVSRKDIDTRSRGCWWWRRCRAISPRCCAAPSRRCCATTTSTSPTGRSPRRAGRRPARFGVDDYVDYLIQFLETIGPGAHVLAVCQPCVQALAAVAVMSEDEHPATPRSMTLMAGPIDTRESPTAVNELAMDKPLSWFETSVIARVPRPLCRRRARGSIPASSSYLPSCR